MGTTVHGGGTGTEPAAAPPAGRARVTLLSPTDLPSVAELFQRVWPGVFDPAEDRTWAFHGNPLGPAPLVGAVDPVTGRVVAARGGIRWPLSDGTPGGRVIQLHGTCVDPQFRRCGLFRATTGDFLRRAAADGVDLVFNVSVTASRAGYETMGWRYLPGMRSYHRVIRPDRVAAVLAGRRSTAPQDPAAALSAGSCSAATGALAADLVSAGAIERRERSLAGLLHTAYPVDFFRWRFSRAPQRFAGTGEMGFCAYRVRWQHGLRDVLVGDLWPGVGAGRAARQWPRPLLRQVARIEKPDTMSLWLSNAHPLRVRLLRLGFLPNLRRYLHFGVRPVSGWGERALDPARWALMAADIDTF